MLYDLRDLIKTYGNKTGLAKALNVHPVTIGRWGDNIPDTSQVKVMRLLDADPSMKRRHNRIRAIRIGNEAAARGADAAGPLYTN